MSKVTMGQEATSYSLETAIQYALENNQTAKNAQLEMDIADRQVGEILAIGLPQINANANLMHNYEIQPAFVPGGTDFTPGVPEGEVATLAFGVPFGSMFDVGLSQMVFDGTFFIGLEAAKTFTELSKKEFDRTNIDVAEAVSKAYFGVLVNRERFGLIQRNFDRIDTLLQDTEKLFANGMAEKIDVSRAKVQFNNLKVELDNYQSIVDVTESLLKFQMGVPLQNEIQLTNEIEDIDFFDFDLAKDFSYEKRVEYQALNVQSELNELDIKQIRAQYYPSLYLKANYGKSAGSLDLPSVFTNDWYSAGSIGLTASMPIFDGMLKKRKVQQRQLKAEQLNNQTDYLAQNIDFEIQQALANYNRSIDRVRAQDENMGLSLEVYDVAKIKYEEGVGSNIEVLDADRSYKEAQVNYFNAIYDALISKVALQKAYGVLL
ncbi:MAG: TolC family protein [Reichenbachiella sp.]